MVLQVSLLCVEKWFLYVLRIACYYVTQMHDLMLFTVVSVKLVRLYHFTLYLSSYRHMYFHNKNKLES